MHQTKLKTRCSAICLIGSFACSGSPTESVSSDASASGRAGNVATTRSVSGGMHATSTSGATGTDNVTGTSGGRAELGGASMNGTANGNGSTPTGGAGGFASGNRTTSSIVVSGGAVSTSGRSTGGSLTARGGSSTGGRTTNASVTSGGAMSVGGKTTGGSQVAGGASGMGGSSGRAMGGIVAVGGATSAGARAAGGATSTGGKATGGTSSAAGAASGCDAAVTDYDQVVLCDDPVAYWTMTKTSGSEPDLTARGNHGSYRGGTLTTTTLPNGDSAVVFDGATQYLTIPSNAAYSIPTTGDFTWEAWIRPSVLEFPNDDGSGYVDWMGKCADYSPTCEWEARMYKTTNSEGRCNRISAYVFNPSAGLGSAADWQPTCGLIQASQWYHVVGAYTTRSQPTTCTNSASYPGSIDIWVNGVKWNQSRHNPTGCMSQYSVIPKANASPVNIGTMAGDGWFPGAIAKVAFFDYILTQAQVTRHYSVMTGQSPTGSCSNDCSL